MIQTKEEGFNEWMKKIKNEYYADNDRMNNSFDRLRELQELQELRELKELQITKNEKL